MEWWVGEWAETGLHCGQISCWAGRVKCREHCIEVIKMKGATGQLENVCQA